MAAVLAIVFVVLLFGLLKEEPRRANPASAGSAGPSSHPRSGVAGPDGTLAYAIYSWRDGKGALYRAAIARQRYDTFVAGERARLDADGRTLSAAQDKALRAGLAPIFDAIDERVPVYANWVFDWWTSWILLAHTFGWTWDELKGGHVLSAPDRVQARLVDAIRRQFVASVLDPEAIEPRVGAVLDGTFAAMREGIAQDCEKYQAAFSGFIRREARRVERQKPAAGWVPEPLWRADSATFGPICRAPANSDAAGLRAKFIALVEANTANGPINDVIVRMARPFATKLISFLALPIIVAAILGGFILPLFRLLPSILSNIVIGVLTGALGGLVIGFAASASVDWLLNRTDAALNRPGFEIDVRRAVVAGQDDFRSRVIGARRQAIGEVLQKATNRLAGQPGA
ncbi:MAG TPA: hypothetical protein VGR91_07105 [Stellaceae bacterium]|nr:hypothetical protein [Stellaceae bacterium]